MLKEFKAFISKGNVIDLAVGVIIGAAFSAIVTSLVNDLIMPAIGIIIGGIDFKSLSLVIGEGSKPAVLLYGNFIQAVINFFIIALTVFLFVKLISKLRKPKAAAPAADPVPTREEQLLEEIRDLLKQQNSKK